MGRVSFLVDGSQLPQSHTIPRYRVLEWLLLESPARRNLSVMSPFDSQQCGGKSKKAGFSPVPLTCLGGSQASAPSEANAMYNHHPR
jgi:hypothetical protein